ncbi:hypothetical protein O181_082070 [Austropuccinia psidii MF-1]|uniref:ubiquitinyl hydrolase 1 n=1 Tax=Austropuccinia psidii MF-1 TaxID=1389203 RepID=A0A9Q3FKA5_9BASI|nr:hypothetical protein [Austropuccinia psidii MF-1]
MDLIPYIYCEKQEPGSMLCAQHALNNLMQIPLWTTENLAEIARKLDLIEDSHLDQANLSSRTPTYSNYDDSGFFSVQVIDDALHQLGLRLIRWRSEEMLPFHDYPENQEAFILNHQLHWFTLRRFGNNADRWYNLNSMTDETPKWIGPNFLSMAISQAETDGYSIFTVRPVLPSSNPSSPQPGSLMVCEADEQAQIFDQLSYSPMSSSSSGSSSTNRRPREDNEDEPPRTRIKTNSQDKVTDLPYEDQIRLAIEASLNTNISGNSKGKGKLHSTADDEIEIIDEINKPNPPNNGAQSTSTKKNDNNRDSIEEDRELAAAIAASLAESTIDSTASNPELFANSDSFLQTTEIDEPSPEELRRKRLARFSQDN